MKTKYWMTILLITLISVLVACSNDETSQQNTDDKVNKEKETTQKEEQPKGEQESTWKEALAAPEVPKTIKEIVEFPVGELAHLSALTNDKDKKKAVEFFKKLPKLGENASSEKMDAYFRKMHEVFHEPFPSKTELIESLKYSAFGSPDIKDKRFHFKENLNVEIILDASGSMAGMINGKSKMAIAKETITSFVASLPNGANIGLRVYGHKGTGTESDKKLSCGSSELVYPLQSYNEGKFNKALNKFEPAGWTPIALALKNAQRDLSKYPAKSNTNIIYLVSDGIATCGGDPVQAAKSLADSNINPIVNVIGFDIGHKGQQQLKNISKAVDGIYTNAKSNDELTAQLDRTKEIAEKWEDWKEDTTYQAGEEHFVNEFDILGFINDWSSSKHAENDNLNTMLFTLRELGYISESASGYLEKKVDEHYTRINEYQEQIDKNLNNMNNKKFNEIKKAIEEKYQDKK